MIGFGLYWFRRPIGRAFPSAFLLVRNAYRNSIEWAADRGRQIRETFGIGWDDLRPAGNLRPQDFSADEWNRRKILTLAPAYQSRFTAFFAAAQAIARRHGREYIIWDAARPLERQLELYGRGRTEPGLIVTDTIASRHLYGLAIDLAMRSPSGGYDSELPPWHQTEVLPLAAQYGLVSLLLTAGIDPPHIEVPESEWPASVAQAVAQVRNDFPGLA